MSKYQESTLGAFSLPVNQAFVPYYKQENGKYKYRWDKAFKRKSDCTKWCDEHRLIEQIDWQVAECCI